MYGGQIRKAYRTLAHIASQQQRFEDAVLAMKELLKLAKDKSARADVYKDIGILYLRQANLNAVRVRVCVCQTPVNWTRLTRSPARSMKGS
jgi:hypothetical protein